MNWLRRITFGSQETKFTYRPDGLRATKTVGGVTTKYLYDGQSLIAEKEGSTLKVSYTNGPNEVISRTGLLVTRCWILDARYGFQIPDVG